MMKSKRIVKSLAAIGIVLVVVASYAGYIYASTPQHLRRPAFQHYHFRTQLLVNGKAVNFAEDKFQEVYAKGNCSTEIAGTPVHFHDHVDQMTHIHWDGMTGGEFLKYYGWNFIGGPDDSLGYRYDKSAIRPHKIMTAGKLLPPIPTDARFYIYVGEGDSYQKKNWNDFLNQDLETFFGKQSLVQPEASAFNPLGWLMPKASAHGAESHTQGESTKTEEELTRINNLLGNVVIFAQEKEPTDQQIKDRFNNLIPLQDSTCGG